MAFLDFFRPKWKHSDAEVRAEAVRQLDEGDTQTLSQIAQHDPDVRVRRIALKRIDDPSILLQIAERDTDDGLRKAAGDKAEELLLESALLESDDEELPLSAVAQIGKPRALLDVVRKSKSAKVRRAALLRIEDERILAEVVRLSDDADLRSEAFAKITEEPVLRDVAINAPNKDIGLAAVEKLGSKGILLEVSTKAKNKAVRALAKERHQPEPEAVESPKDPGETKEAGKAAQKAAPKVEIRVTMSAAELALEKRRRATMQNLCQRAEVAANNPDLSRAKSDFAQILSSWNELAGDIGDDPGEEALRKRFEKAQKSLELRKQELEQKLKQREKAEAEAQKRGQKEAEEAAPRIALCEEVEALLKEEVSDRPGQEPLPARLEAKRAAWAALPQVTVLSMEARTGLDRRFQAAVRELHRRHEQSLHNAHRLDRLSALVADIEHLAKERGDREDTEAQPAEGAEGGQPEAKTDAPAEAQAASQDKAQDRADRQQRGAKKGRQGRERDQDRDRKLRALTGRFEEMSQGLPETVLAPLKERLIEVAKIVEAAREASRKRHREELEKRAADLESYVEKLEKLAEEAGRKRLEQIQGDFKDRRGPLSALSQMPQAKADALRDRIAKIRDRISIRLGEMREEDEWKRWANLPKLELLCEYVEGLKDAPDPKKAQQELKIAREAWKTLVIPREKAESLKARFDQAAEAVQGRLREHFAANDEARAENLKKKEELCLKAESLSESTKWKDAAEQLKALQEAWKGIGPVPKDQSDAIWKRFRAACDKFFARRKEHNEERAGEKKENEKKLEALCQRAEALCKSTDWKDAAEQLKALQGEWKAVGHAGKEAADTLWKRFRAACDSFFAARKEHFEAVEEERKKNLVAKEALCQQVEALCQTEVGEQEAVDHVRRLNQEWKAIGPVPRDHADAVWGRFREACDRLMLKRWEPPPEEAGAGKFENRLPLAGIAARLGLQQADK